MTRGGRLPGPVFPARADPGRGTKHPAAVEPDMCVPGALTFSHQGLATTTLVLTLLTTVTGFLLLGARYGYPPRGRWRGVLRVAHTAFGVLLVVYLLATYLIVPI